MPKKISDEVQARLVPDPHGRQGHWHDPIDDQVYSFGDRIPEGIDPDLVPKEWALLKNEPAQAEPNDIAALQVENAQLQERLARLLALRELEKLTIAQLTERAIAEGLTIPEGAKKPDLIALFVDPEGETDEDGDDQSN